MQSRIAGVRMVIPVCLQCRTAKQSMAAGKKLSKEKQADSHRRADTPKNYRAHRIVDGLVCKTDQGSCRHIDVAR